VEPLAPWLDRVALQIPPELDTVTNAGNEFMHPQFSFSPKMTRLFRQNFSV